MNMRTSIDLCRIRNVDKPIFLRAYSRALSVVYRKDKRLYKKGEEWVENIEEADVRNCLENYIRIKNSELFFKLRILIVSYE